MKRFISTIAVLVLMPLQAQAVVMTGWGTQASSSTFSDCPSFCTGIATFDTNGGPGVTSASSALNNAHGVTTSSATLGGPTSTPVLKARAQSNAGTGAFASAFAVQGYTYTGTGPRTYTLNYNLHGVHNGPDSFVRGELGIILGTDLPFTTDWGTLKFEYLFSEQDRILAESSDSLPAGPVIGLLGSLTFTLDTGDSFFLWSKLSVGGERGGFADAGNTFGMSFADDTDLVAASAAPVPEPSTWLLMGLGLFGLGWMRKRRA